MNKIFFVIPAVLLLVAFTGKSKRTVFLIGDSTMANKSVAAFPETGWGQVLPAFADTSRLSFENYAKNGRSTKSFIDEGLWATVIDRVKPGDYVFIQFGHNDAKKEKPGTYARAETQYKINLKRFVDETRAKGGIPVIFTSIVRRDFNDNGTLHHTHGAYPDAAKEVAVECGVTMIDLEAETHLLVERYGIEASTGLFLHTLEGQYDNRPKGGIDNTHLNRAGAIEVAGLAVKCIKKQIPELASCF